MSISKVSVTLGYEYDLIQVCYNATYLHKKYDIKGNIIEQSAGQITIWVFLVLETLKVLLYTFKVAYEFAHWMGKLIGYVWSL